MRDKGINLSKGHNLKKYIWESLKTHETKTERNAKRKTNPQLQLILAYFSHKNWQNIWAENQQWCRKLNHHYQSSWPNWYLQKGKCIFIHVHIHLPKQTIFQAIKEVSINSNRVKSHEVCSLNINGLKLEISNREISEKSSNIWNLSRKLYIYMCVSKKTLCQRKTQKKI